MKKLLRNKKGFTLMEMLIVVAIIGILVSVSIPVFSGQLEKAKEATDKANERAAKAAAVTQYLTNGVTGTTGTYYYNAATGTTQSTRGNIAGYGKHGNKINKVVKVTIAANGTSAGVPVVTWE